MVAECCASCFYRLSLALPLLMVRCYEAAYRGNHAHVLTEAGWEASCSVLSIRKVLITASIQGELEVFQVESQL